MRMRIASRARITGPAAVLVGATALTVAGLAGPASATPRPAGAAGTHDPITRLFRYTGHTVAFFVPRGVRYLTIVAAGASGQGNHRATGGLGAVVRSTVAVTPRTRLLVRVGGTGSRGGFNGGGHGPGAAGTGGGASSVSTSTGRSLVVAGGGGGAGARGSCLSAGGDGGNAGSAGSAGEQCTARARGGRGGGPGLSRIGGYGGSGGHGTTTDGTVGRRGVRGAGGHGTTTRGTFRGASGGGGGGYYGGGAGGSGGRSGLRVGAGGGGGGGSSLGYVTGPAFGPASVSIRYTITAPLTITSSSPLHGGAVGRSYRTRLAASGGRPPYTWSLVSGSLPRGLALSRSGVISGTPRVAGTRLFRIRVRDSVRRSAAKLFRLTIVGRANLAVRLSHVGRFRHHSPGTFRIEVTNTGSAATNPSVPTKVVLTLPRGLVVRQGGTGIFWQCSKHRNSALCVRRAPIHAHQTTTITVTVFVEAAAGTIQRAEATVFPLNTNPAGNTSTNLVYIFRR